MTDKNFKYKIISLFLVYIILIISALLAYKYFTGNLRVTIETKSGKNAFMQIFYDTGKGHNEKERLDIRIDANPNFQIITSLLPSNYIKSLRIDPMIEPGTVFIKSIMLEGFSGKYIWSVTDIIKDFRPQRDIGKFEMVNHSLQIDSLGNDPQFVSLKPIPDIGINRLTKISLLANLMMIIIFISIAISRINLIHVKDKLQYYLVLVNKAIRDLKGKVFFRLFAYGVKAILIGLFLYLFAMSFLVVTSRFAVNSNNLIDGGWMYALSRLQELKIDMGRDIFFTYGPLASYLSWVIVPGDLHHQYHAHLRYMIVVFILYVFYLLIFIRLFRINFTYAIIGATVFLSNPFHFYGYGGINDIAIYGAIALLSILSYEKFMSPRYAKGNENVFTHNNNSDENNDEAIFKDKTHCIKSFFFLFLLSAFSAGALLFKTSLGIAGFLSIVMLIFIAVYKKNITFLKYLLVSMIIFIFASISIYMALTDGSGNFFKFIKHSYDQSKLYSQMMANSQSDIWPYVFPLLLIIGLLIALIRFKETRIPILIIAPTLFIAYKACFVRYDVARLLIFLSVIPLILISISFRLRTVNISRNFLFIAILAPFLFGLFWVHNHYIIKKVLFYPKAGQQILSVYLKSGIRGYVNEKMLQSQTNLETISNKVDIKIKDAARGHEIAVIPWALAIPDAIDAKPLFYPSLQFYSGYTKGLDEANLKYFQTLDENSNVLLEFVSIDGRYPLYDVPRTYEWLLANYKIRESSKKYSLLERSQETTKIFCEEPIFVGFGTEINLKENGLLQAYTGTEKIRFKRLMVTNLIGVKYALRSLLLRAPYTYINLELSNGEKYKYKIFPEFLQRGLWLSPFIRNQDDIKSWISRRQHSIPQVIKVSIKEDASVLKYINKKPRIYLQDCSLD